MDVIINYTRLTTSDRLADRFLTCQAYSPQDEETKDKGSIFTQVEILNPWFSTSQVGQSIINTLIREYYKADDTSDLNNFETAIKGVNESLAQIAQSGETDWIGRLSSVLVLINGNEAHFAQTGQSHAYLYRGDKINHITEGLEHEASPHPLKTFTNLTSGTLQEGDKIIIANPTFFEIIDPSELKIIINQYSPTQAAIEAGKILKGRGIKHANAIFIEITTKNALANLPPDQKQDTVYINEQLSSLTTNLKNIWRNLILPLSVALKSYFSKSLSDSRKKLVSKTRQNITSGSELSETADTSSSDPEKIVERENTSDDRGKSDLSEKTKLYIVKIKNRLKRFLLRLGVSKPHGPRIYLIALAVVVVILSTAIGFSILNKRSKANEQDLQNKANQIVALEGEASEKLTQNDEVGALAAYNQILDISNELKNSKFSVQANESYNNAYSKILELSRAQEISDFTQTDLPINPSLFALSNSKLYLISKDKKFFTDSNRDVIDLSGQISGEISQATGVENKIALSTQDGSLYIIDPSLSSATKQKITLNYQGLLKSFFDNIYLLDPPSNQIWKIVNDNGYSDNTAFVADENISMRDSIGMAIDGSVYTLNQSCTINRISRGELVANFKITLPANDQTGTCTDIFTSEGSSDLIIFAKSSKYSKVIRLGKNGGFVKQYILKDMTCDHDCFFDPDTNLFYHYKDNKLISANIN